MACASDQRLLPPKSALPSNFCSYYPRNGRYHLISVSGYEITAHSGKSGSGGKPKTVLSILDTVTGDEMSRTGALTRVKAERQRPALVEKVQRLNRLDRETV